MMRTSLLFYTLLLLGVGGVAVTAAGGEPTRRVHCEKIIGQARSGTASGRRVILRVISIEQERRSQRAFPTGDSSRPFFRKMGLMVRGGAPGVTVSVPAASKQLLGIEWGNSGPTGTLSVAPCPNYGTGWNAYAGGLYLDAPRACVPVDFRVGRKTVRVRFGIGTTC